MYRGEHHPTDALGACLLAACWVSVLYWTVRPNARPETVTEAASSAADVPSPVLAGRP
jgi:membrane-associated phospholipid phosphatase